MKLKSNYKKRELIRVKIYQLQKLRKNITSVVSWSWELQLKAEKNLVGFDVTVRRQIIDKLDWLVVNFNSIVPVSLKGEFKEFFKFRIGDIRVFYKINWKNNKIIICYIAKRDRAYL